MSDHPIVPLGASGPPPHIETPSGPRGDVPAPPRRSWGTYVLAAAVGAVLAGGGVVALGPGERVVDRPVTERVLLNPTASHLLPSAPATLEGVGRQVDPTVVGIEPAGDAAPGSGVIVRDDGIVVTSAAFVADGAMPQVRLEDGSLVTAELVGTDPVTGLAVLDLAGQGHTPGLLSTVADLDVGVATYVVHRDVPDRATTSSAVAGDTHRYVGPEGTPLDGIELDGIELDGAEVDGAAAPAALGAPAVNGRGAIVGIVTAVEDGGSWYVAPVEVAHRVADSLLADGEVRHSWLGIEGTDVAGTGSGSPDTTLPTEGGGTEVASVVPDSPAATGGLRAGDVIVALDDEPIARTPDLTLALRSRAPGDRVDVTVRRDDGSEVTLVLTLGEPPEPAV